MSDFSLINKTAHRIYPTHLKEVDNSSFSWSGVLPTDAKSRLVKDSEGHKQTDDRNSHTLTHKLKGGASIEFNIVKNGKNHIAMAKYHKGGKLFTAIHSHEDPNKAMKTAYDSVARRIVTEEAEIALIEKMEKRIEKKTGKLSDKKEKIDVEPSEEKELKEATPPGMESWVKKNKARFVKEYGEKKGHEVLYATAWKLHNKMNEEELKEGTIEVIPHFIGVMPDGRKVSPFSAGVHHVEKTGKWTWGVTDHNGNYTTGMSRKPVESKEEAIKIAHEVAAKTLHRVKLSESTHTYTKEGLAKQIKYHENRAAHHDSEAQASFNKAQDLTGDKADLHFNAAKGHKAIADLHRKHIYDLKSSVGMNEAELNELSPHTLGMYTKIASIDMAHHRAAGAISHRAQIDAEIRGSKESAKTHEDNKIQHDKKATKRLNGIIKATDKLVRKTVVKEEQLEETRAAPHPDKVVMTSGIRKDLGGGYMAKTKNGHFYKLDVKALGEPGKGRELPKIGSVLDTSKHKFIGKDKVDLGMLKESTENNYLGQLVGKYLTHSGKTGIEIRRHAIGTYSYSGEWGAGGGHSKTEMDKTANRLLRLHPRHKIEKKYYGDLHNIKEDLDHDHPDMKAYHAACKARDEAHLASIRYRMNHDIKQPEHRAKYDELEAEHHRLRDIENLAAEKVHGRLFAHHAGFKE